MVRNKFTNLLYNEEKQALKIYLFSFYVTLVLYDLLFYYIYPKFITSTEPGKYYSIDISLIIYITFFGLLPLSLYLIKRGKHYSVKYVYISCYVVLSAINDCVVFWDDSSKYSSGSAIELILVLFSPIFINKRFFWFATIATTFRYLLVGILIGDRIVFFPIVLILILAGIAYILLNRFVSYVDALNTSHEQLKHKEKLAFIGQMATSLGHEIKNPLASLKGFTQLQREKYPGDQHYYSIMEQEIERINSIVNDLMVIGKPRSTNFQKNNIKDIIAYVISISKQLACEKKVTLAAVLEDELPLIECDENQLKQVFINLINNGIESMDHDHGGTLKIHSSIVSKNLLSIRVVDQGSGIDKSEIEKLFEPFYTTKPEGTGLGLMVTKKIVEDHQGEIQVDSEINKGTTITITLPISQK
ncbi:ATP-binding protein [Ferdinandcohnia quinoae]|uniref:histidine kinase n=1 Tax=Fredinandcohnia quinoae TaxID=2918902 RepID=A0AAW5E2G8_9BACI|nr:ATP-binding protein [Fredinandcohnia sp. SECRCQ15]MCH1624267.1 ATP-binding protein [Fredinandcohnia sp. SECRCQ15]